MNNLEKTILNFKNKKIVVIGDVMLDRYLEGSVTRINPEAPVPIVALKKEFHELGGAANVAANIASLGGEVSLFGFIGKGRNAGILKNLLNKKGINHFLEEGHFTIEKTRILGEGQQLLRYDHEEIEDKKIPSSMKINLIKEVESAVAVLISDYAKGTITRDLMDLLAVYRNKIIIDPKPKNKGIYKGAFLITPNEKEAIEMSSCSDVTMAGNFLRRELDSNVLITRSEKGMFLFSEENSNLPTYAKDVYDVTGAGDTAISTLALSIAAGASLKEAAIIANHAAGIAVEKKGTYAPSVRELINKVTLEESKILTFDELKKIILDNKRKRKKTVWTNGCFDLLHVGHVHYLKEAKKLGDSLVVGINSDESVRSLKGPDRPIQSITERAEIISSLEFVDHVLIFSDLSVEKYIRELQPEIYVKGGDYTKDSINPVEKKALENYGGQISFVPQVEGKSSSNIIRKVSDNNLFHP